MNAAEIVNKRIQRDESALRKALDQLAIGYWEALDQMNQWDPELISEDEQTILELLISFDVVQEYRDR